MSHFKVALAAVIGAWGSASAADVACYFTVNGAVKQVYVNGVRVSVEDDSCLESWDTECLIVFEDESASGVQLLGISASADDATCETAGFALKCSSEDLSSLWNDVQSDASWKALSVSSSNEFSRRVGWYLASYDSNTWNEATASTADFTCGACGRRSQYDKIWGLDENGSCNDVAYFLKSVCTGSECPIDCEGEWGEWSDCTFSCGGSRARTFTTSTAAQNDGASCSIHDGATESEACGRPCAIVIDSNCQGDVTCEITIDNIIDGFYVGGVDITSLAEPETCLDEWKEKCTLSFPDCSKNGQTVAIAGGEIHDIGCDHSGLVLECSSTQDGSAWNDVRSDFGASSQWLTASYESPIADTEPAWYEPDFDDSAWSVPEASTSAFRCDECSGTEGVDWDKAWTHDCLQYGYFRQTVETVVDCAGEWAQWSHCDVSCGAGLQSRVFETAVQPSYSGEPCPASPETQECTTRLACPTDCQGDWSAWDTCSDSCGSDGTKHRTYSISVEATGGGAECEAADNDLMETECNRRVSCPVHCIGAWGSWGDCGRCTQGVGRAQRTFEVSVEAAFDGDECEVASESVVSIDCECGTDCQGDWSAWDTCSDSCGSGGTKHRTYSISVEATGGGAECEAADNDLMETECNRRVSCPVHCIGAWGSWGDCTSCTQGTGTSQRTFEVSVEAAFDGDECEVASESVVSMECECGIDCQGEWEAWSACSRSCGPGVQTRTFAVSVAAENGGTDCAICDGIMSSAACDMGCADDDDDDDDDADYPFAPYVTADNDSGSFSIFGHYSNSNNHYTMAGVDISIVERDDAGGNVQAHSFETFDNQDISVDLHEESYTCVHATRVEFGAILGSGRSTVGALAVNTFVFSEPGTISSPNGVQEWEVVPGDIMFTMDVSTWNFDESCSSLEIVIELTHGSANQLFNRRRRGLMNERALKSDDTDSDDVEVMHRGCAEDDDDNDNDRGRDRERMRSRFRGLHEVIASSRPSQRRPSSIRRGLKKKKKDRGNDNENDPQQFCMVVDSNAQIIVPDQVEIEGRFRTITKTVASEQSTRIITLNIPCLGLTTTSASA